MNCGRSVDNLRGAALIGATTVVCAVDVTVLRCPNLDLGDGAFPDLA